MKYELKLKRNNISDDELLTDVKRVAGENNKNTVSANEYKQKGRFDVRNVTRRFGTWNTMLKRAALEIGFVVNIPNEALYINMENVWVKMGRQPTRADMKKTISKYSAGAYRRAFGSWNNALKAFVDYINQEEEVSVIDSIERIPAKEEVAKQIKRTNPEISDRLRFRILLRDGFTCRKCGRSPLKNRGVELHVDHILPWSKGGETTPENLETKCKKCNLGKGNAFNV